MMQFPFFMFNLETNQFVLSFRFTFMKSILSFILIVYLSAGTLVAQNPNIPLTHALTLFEREMTPTNLSQPVISSNSISPFQNPRSMAEWEELQGLIITWDTGYGNGVTNILKEIVRHAKEECEVIIVCANANSVISSLEASNIDTSTGIRFVVGDFDRIWVRDYGPNTVYANDVDTLGLVDWVYNRNRPKDDIVSNIIAEDMDLPLIATTSCPGRVVHTGGNFMSDGLGLGFSSELVLEENDPTSQWTNCPLSESELDEQMDLTMGIENYVKMETLPYDAIHHIDMHMKLLDEKTLLVGEYPMGTADGPQIEANIQYVLNNFTTTAGEDFEIIRIPMPPDFGGSYPPSGDYRTYSNAVFVNNTILVPTYQQQYDEEALAVWQEAMPGYNVVGINCNSIIPYLGALHCITKELGVNEPLWISTNRVVEACAGETIDIMASIKHISGISSATLFYKTDLTAAYQAVDMNIGFAGDDWFGSIPASDEGPLYYYIEATATNGKTITRPMPAPEGYFEIDVKDCTIINNDEVANSNFTLETIFPNPAAAITCIPVLSDQKIDAEIELLDLLGRKVSTIFQGAIPAGDSKYFINASEYPAGTYFVQIKTSTTIQSQKIIIE